MVITSLVLSTLEPPLNIKDTRVSNCVCENSAPEGRDNLFTASTTFFVSLVKKVSALVSEIGEV